ncbi:MAG: carbohydrate ABC transporter permease [Christensenellales bacterium]|jgi:ABC-type glycerol-3-phosphate transport system permease component
MMRNQQTKFSANKRVGLTLIAIGVVLLVAAFISVPFQWGKGIRRILLIGGFASFLVAAPLMWKKGLANIRSGKAMPGSLLRIRQSGSFDFLVLFLAIGLLLLVLGGVGKVSYQATLDKHIELAGMEGKIATLEEARRNSAFIEYNFTQDLHTLSKNYNAFFLAGAVILAFVIICLLYIRFVSPIVAADDSLRAAHSLCRRSGQTVVAVFVTLIMIFPIYWMIISSFKTSPELLASVPTLWPKKFVWENYPNVIKRAPFDRYLINTLVTTCVIMLTEVTFGVLAAYGFSKGTFKGQNILFMLVLGALMVPIQVTFVPIYVLIARLNAIDTYLGVILPSMVSAYFIFMLRQNFMAVDDSYIEAGKLDGMGRFGTIIHVLCPMCMPTLITVSIISFINGWNSYFWPKMVTKTAASRTIAVGVQQLKNTFAGQEVSNYNEIMAGAVMAIVPIVVLFLFLQKYIMTGMSKAAMK